MPWIRVDDHFNEHPKLAAVGPLGWALWMAGLAYCNRNLTDGFIPWSTAGGLVSWDYLHGDTPRRLYIGGLDSVYEEGAVESDEIIELLVEAGLWSSVKGGYQVHDYADFQPTKQQVIEERAKKAAAGKAGGLATALARAEASAVAESQPVPVPNPKPVENSPLPLTRGRRTNGTNPRATGDNPRAQGTSPRQEIKRQKSDPTSIHDILERSRRQ
jgi:hypothetical protein